MTKKEDQYLAGYQAAVDQMVAAQKDVADDPPNKMKRMQRRHAVERVNALREELRLAGQYTGDRPKDGLGVKVSNNDGSEG